MVSNGPKLFVGWLFFFSLIQDTGKGKKIGCGSQEKKRISIWAFMLNLPVNATEIWKLIKKSEHTSVLAYQAPPPKSTLPLPTVGEIKTLVCSISIIFVTCCRQLSRGMFNILTAVQ